VNNHFSIDVEKERTICDGKAWLVRWIDDWSDIEAQLLSILE